MEQFFPSSYLDVKTSDPVPCCASTELQAQGHSKVSGVFDLTANWYGNWQIKQMWQRDNDIVKTVVSLGGKCARPTDCWHLFARLTHQGKSVPNLPQFFSSDPSEQSLSVSQSQLLGIHRWLSQVKKDAGQEMGAWEGQFSSSLPSTQSDCWSHFQCAGMHSPLRQVKAEGAQELSTMKINWSPRCLFLCQRSS